MDVKEILQEKMNNDFRASQMCDVLSARIMFLKSKDMQYAPIDIEKRKAKIEAYEDCLSIIKKDFVELQLPFENQYLYEEHIKKVRDKVVEKICPIDNSTRGTKEYISNMRKASIVADIIESLCYEMFEAGYEYKNSKSESPGNAYSYIRANINDFINHTILEA